MWHWFTCLIWYTWYASFSWFGWFWLSFVGDWFDWFDWFDWYPSYERYVKLISVLLRLAWHLCFILFSKCFFVVPTFHPHLQPNPIVNTYTAYQNMLQGRGKGVRLGKQHNAPTHLPSYCIFRLVELSCAQFDYMHCAEM